MDTFKVIKTKPLDTESAVKQLEKFVQKENESKAKESDVTDTTRARISDDVFNQLETACNALKNNN